MIWRPPFCDRPVFVTGYGRSGTTLLWNILGKSPSLHLQAENNLIYGLSAAGHDFERIATHDELARQICDCAGTGRVAAEFLARFEDLKSLLRDENATNLKLAVEAVLREKSTTDRWGDKSLTTIFALQPIMQIWPGAKIVHIVRDPRDVACSYFEKKFGKGALDGMSVLGKILLMLQFRRHALRWRHWNNSVIEFREFAENAGASSLMTVRYEDLVADPEPVVKRICAFLAIDFSPDMIAGGTEHIELVSRQAHANLAKPISGMSVGRYGSIFSEAVLCVEFYATLMTTFGYLKVERRPLRSRIRWQMFRLTRPLMPKGRNIGMPKPVR